MTDLPVFEMDRRFNAPSDLVWKTWTDPNLVTRWYGPNVTSIVHEMDVRPGGLWRHEMRWQGGGSFERMEYTTVTPTERLEWNHSATNSDWEIAANPMMPDWPKVLATAVTFTPDGAATDLRLTWTPLNATAAEIACFAAAIGGLGKGWGAGMEKLDALLSELTA